MIDVDTLTLTYPNGKGIFDVNFSVDEGTVMGCLGPNGAGKTTAIRALLGFMRPDSGSCRIRELDCMQDAPAIQRILGYIPGEITFFDGMRGDEFLDFICRMRGTKDRSTRKRLLEMFELDVRGKIRKFSKGMKQKLGIVTAFMHNPEVLILDEPTSGLDPLMQNRFLELLTEEKGNNKTILMSSHIFEEVESVCDEVLIIREGRIAVQSDVKALKTAQRKGYIIRPADPPAALVILREAGFEIGKTMNDSIEAFVTGEDVDRFIKTVSRFQVIDFEPLMQSLEDVFMQYYGQKGQTA